MKVHLVAVGTRMPAWVTTGFQEYAKRLPRECALLLQEIPPGPRGKNEGPARAIKEEGQRMLAALPKRSHIVALDERGTNWSTKKLAENMQGWMEQGQDVALLIGGPDGLSADCRAVAKQTWSLSALTLPHPMVRILVAEQIYRAWSLIKGHPYHRD